MKIYFSPNNFQKIAQHLQKFRWTLLLWSSLFFILYLLLQNKVNDLTPVALIWLILFLLFSALQMLVFGAFIFFFQYLHSSKASNIFWFKFYQIIEWCEAILFFLLLPLPSLVFIYSLAHLN